MYIDPHFPQRDLITHLDHSFLLICPTKVYSTHRLLTETMNHILENAYINLLQSAVAFPMFDRLIWLFLLKEGDLSELSEFLSSVYDSCYRLPSESINHTIQMTM